MNLSSAVQSVPGVGLDVALQPPETGVGVSVQLLPHPPSQMSVELPLLEGGEEEPPLSPQLPRRRQRGDRSPPSIDSPACSMYLELVRVIIDIVLKLAFVRACLMKAWVGSAHFLNKPVEGNRPNFDACQVQSPSWFTPDMRRELNLTVSCNYVDMVRRSAELLPSDQGVCDRFCLALGQASFTHCFEGDDETSDDYREYCQSCTLVLQEIIVRFFRQCGSAFSIRLGDPSTPPLSSDFVFCLCRALVESASIHALSICGPFEQGSDLEDLVKTLQRYGAITSLEMSLSRQDIERVLPLLSGFTNRPPSLPPIYVTVRNYNTDDEQPLSRDRLSPTVQAMMGESPSGPATIRFVNV